MTLWFAKDIRKTVRGLVIVGENIEGTRSVEVLLTDEVVEKLRELIK